MNITVPVVQAALVAALGTHFDAANQIVDFGLPAAVPPDPKRERIWVLDEEGLQRTRQAAYTTETYRLRVQVEVKTVAGTAKDCSDRRWAIVNEIGDVVRSAAFRRYLADDDGILGAESAHRPWEKGFIAVSVIRISIKARG